MNNVILKIELNKFEGKPEHTIFFFWNRLSNVSAKVTVSKKKSWELGISKCPSQEKVTKKNVSICLILLRLLWICYKLLMW